MFSIKGEYMLSINELGQELREVVEFYTGELEDWELRREGRDFYLLVIPYNPEVLAIAYSYKAIGRMVGFISEAYAQEFRSVDFVVAFTGEDTELPYFCLKLKGY